ncbi:MAG: hypothetical protein ACI4OV_02410 [Victivallaceae bacterium]
MTQKPKTISERLTLVEKITEDTNNIVKKLEAAIYGNGEPGLKTNLEVLKKSVENHHKEAAERLKEQKSDWKWVVATLVAIGSVLTSIVAIFTR